MTGAAVLCSLQSPLVALFMALSLLLLGMLAALKYAALYLFGAFALYLHELLGSPVR
jgi:hypothetical protein